MSAKSESIVKSLLESIKSPSKETQPYDTSATVTRVEDDTVFVHIPGGVAETPCSKTINCKVGDTVQVRVGGGRAWIVGNASAPPTDDTTANTAIRKTNQLGDSLTKLQRIAGNTDQYFWHVETGEDTGSHITEIPKERFLEAPALGGGNLLLRSNGIAIRDGLNELATFSSSAIQFNIPSVGTVAASIGSDGLYIQKGVIKLGNKQSASDTTNSGTYIDANGNMSTSNIIATGGTIGGWTISATDLYRSNGTNALHLNSNGLQVYKVGLSNSTYGVDGAEIHNSTGSLVLLPTNIQQAISGAITTITPSKIELTRTTGDTRFDAISGNYQISFSTSSGGTRGIADYVASKWLCYWTSAYQCSLRGNEIWFHDDSDNQKIRFGHDTQKPIFQPQSNGEIYLGTSTLRWAEVYCTRGAFNGSDLKEKEVINDFNWKVDDFISGLKPIAFRRKYDDGSKSTRISLGFGAQDVAKLAKDLDVGDLRLYEASIVDKDEEGNKVEKPYHGEEIDDSKLSWSLGYTELIAPMVLEIQQLMNRVSELEARLNE